MTQSLLYVGSLRPGGNGLDRVAIFESAGFRVVKADRFGFMEMGNRLEQSLAARYHFGRSVFAFNQMLLNLADKAKFDTVFADKGVWIYPKTLATLKKAAARRLAIHFTPDAQFLENRSRHFYSCLPDYDLAITTKTFEMDSYRKNGVQNVKLVHQGYGPRLKRYAQKDIPKELQSEVCYIGHCQAAYTHVLKAIAEKVPLTIWGPGWQGYAQKNTWARGLVRGDGVYGADYAKALSGAKIAIGLLSKRIPEKTTTRSFEIPACGTMMLAEYNDEHAALFENGKEAIFFSNPEEAAQQAVHYLRHDECRAKIAEAGYIRSKKSGYSAREQFESIISWLSSDLKSLP